MDLTSQFKAAMMQPDSEDPTQDQPAATDDADPTCPTCGASVAKIQQAQSGHAQPDAMTGPPR